MRQWASTGSFGIGMAAIIKPASGSDESYGKRGAGG